MDSPTTPPAQNGPPPAASRAAGPARCVTAASLRAPARRRRCGTPADIPADIGEFTTDVPVRTWCAESEPRYRRIGVTDPGELVAAVPAMVGFVPERSLVVAVLRSATEGASPRIEVVVRFDLAPLEEPESDAMAPLIACLARICAAEEATEVLVVIVDDRRNPRSAVTPDPDDAPPPGVGILGDLDTRLARRGLAISGGWAVRAIEAGQPWWNLFVPRDRGVVADPASSRVALAQVLDGRPLHRSRAERAALLDPDTRGQSAVTHALGAAVVDARESLAGAMRAGGVDRYRRGVVEYVLWQIHNYASGGILEPPESARVVVGLRDRAVRDCMFALAVGEHAGAAESLWLCLVRVATGPDRADIAVLLAYSAYVRGDGPFAGMVLDAARAADPANSMAALLETSLRAGMRPEALRRLAVSGYAVAAGLGIDLGSAPPR